MDAPVMASRPEAVNARCSVLSETTQRLRGGDSMAQEVALVTGASSGIGEALARRIARDRRHVVLVARRAERLEALARELGDAHGVGAHVIVKDLLRPGAPRELVEEVARRGLTVDWLVNNAGFGTAGRFDRLPVEVGGAGRGPGGARRRTGAGAGERRHEQPHDGGAALRAARDGRARGGHVPEAPRGVMRAALACALGVLATAAAADAPLPEVATALDRIKSASTVELTTTGRKTGKEHKKPVWFVVQDGTIVVQAGKDGKTDWYRNLTKTPTAVVRQDGYSFRVRAVMVTDAQRVEAVHKLFTAKYTTAWLLSFLGSSIGQGRPVELVPVAVSVKR